MDGNDIADAQVMTQPDSYGNQQYVVSLTLTSDGAQKFKEATERNIGKPIYIVYDNEIISYPTVNTVIENGQAVRKGDPMLKLDLDYLRENAPSVASPVLCTELEDNQKIRLLNEGEIKAGDELFAIDIYEA